MLSAERRRKIDDKLMDYQLIPMSGTALYDIWKNNPDASVGEKLGTTLLLPIAQPTNLVTRTMGWQDATTALQKFLGVKF